MSDNDISQMNSIIVGFTGTNSFTTNDLKTLSFSSITPISTLGSLTGWSTAQVEFI